MLRLSTPRTSGSLRDHPCTPALELRAAPPKWRPAGCRTHMARASRQLLALTVGQQRLQHAYAPRHQRQPALLRPPACPAPVAAQRRNRSRAGQAAACSRAPRAARAVHQAVLAQLAASVGGGERAASGVACSCAVAPPPAHRAVHASGRGDVQPTCTPLARRRAGRPGACGWRSRPVRWRSTHTANSVRLSFLAPPPRWASSWAGAHHGGKAATRTSVTGGGGAVRAPHGTGAPTG